MLFVGDVHGKFNQYFRLINGFDKSVQVGDMGFNYPEIPAGHVFVKGNHDNYEVTHSNELGDFGMYYDIFFIRGAYSPDRAWRKEGFNWFTNEELSTIQMIECLNLYSQSKPRIVVSHDCPQQLVDFEASATRLLLQECFRIHKPEFWIFGHHHIRLEEKVDGTKFIGLEELGTFVLE